MRLGIDFGTTNSVVAMVDDTAAARTLRLGAAGDPAGDACRTLLCVWQERDGGRKRLRDAIGQAAIDAILTIPPIPG